MALEQPIEMKTKGKRPRMICTTCLKPGAVQYINRKTKAVIYEHRDEPPVREFMYRGQKMYRYRRCFGGVMGESLGQIIEHGIQQQSKPKSKKPDSGKEKEIEKLSKMVESVERTLLDLINMREEREGTGKHFEKIEYRKNP
jgi:hypothetical protein